MDPQVLHQTTGMFFEDTKKGVQNRPPFWDPGGGAGHFRRSEPVNHDPIQTRNHDARDLFSIRCGWMTIILDAAMMRFARGDASGVVDISSKHRFGNLTLQMARQQQMFENGRAC